MTIPEIRTQPSTPTLPKDGLGEIEPHLALEPLAEAHARGQTSAEWIGREKVKYFTLQDRANRQWRALKKDCCFAVLDAEMRAAEQARRAATAAMGQARRNGDTATVRDKTALIERTEQTLREHAVTRETMDGWKVYAALSRAADDRVREMRRMWEAVESVAFDNAWKGEFGDRYR